MNNIPMNAPMALATQQGVKTQTRRSIKGDPRVDDVGHWICSGANWGVGTNGKPYVKEFIKWKAPYKIGEVIWVREPVRVEHHTLANVGFLMAYRYLSDTTLKTMRVPERFKKLPKWIEKEQGIPNGCIREMARTFIRVADIRVERLNEISEDDCLKEGIEKGLFGFGYKNYINHKKFFEPFKIYKYLEKNVNGLMMSFCSLWESINGKNSFDNRWVWVIEFELISKEEAING